MSREKPGVRLGAALRFLSLAGLFLCVLASAIHLFALAWLFSRRLAFPFDLEWMEGGMLCHSLRLLDGKPLYGPPSLDFIPFLYTPLYPALVALFAKLVGLGYALGRSVSVVAYVLTSLIAYRFVLRAGGTRVSALFAIALPAAAFPLTGAFYDLARPDSLWLLLTTAALFVLYGAARDDSGARRSARTLRDGHLEAAAAALLFVLAFLTKQTASPIMLAAGAALLLLNARLVPTFGAALALFGLPALYLINRATGGWFYTYVYTLHQSHAFFARRAWVETPIALLSIVGPAILVLPFALAGRRSPALLYAAWLALVGGVTACVASGTQWAITNAYIPGVFFPALAIGIGAGRLVKAAPLAPRFFSALVPLFVFGLLTTSLLLKLPALDHRGRTDDAVLNLSRARLYHRFDLRRFVPGPADREAGLHLVERIRSTDGDVLIPFHPFYAFLAGKPTFVHQMGVMDIAHAGLGPPHGLAEAIAARRFRLVILDDKIEGKWGYWPGLREDYDEADRFAGPHVVSGAMTVPSLAMKPR